MRKITIILLSVAMFVGCRKQPAVVEAKFLAAEYLSAAEIQDAHIGFNNPGCHQDYTYRFSFIGIKNEEKVTGCICWTSPSAIAIHVDDEADQQP